MKEQHPEHLFKPFANRLARFVLSEEASRLLRLIRAARMFEPESVADQSNQTESQRVGIWTRVPNGGTSCFERCAEMIADWHLWANTPRIEPKGNSYRILLFGESVARGQFYDPQFTPASALETILRHRFPDECVEVIDLARTNLHMDGLSELVRSALILEPDFVVIFAGNNWHPFIALDDLASLAALIGFEGIPGIKRYAEQRLRADIKHLVTEIVRLYRQESIPIVWVIPEFNLSDWQDGETNAPHLPGEANHRWLAHHEEARRALQRGDTAEAATLAQGMVALDEGVTVTGLRILAECSRRVGDLVSARRYLERARDALIWDPSATVSPRAFSVTQETLRHEAHRYGFEIVDLPRLFDSYLQGALPDSELFLDYCHLSAKGIRIAMAATAAAILKLRRGESLPWSTLAGDLAPPGPEIEAEAALLAAIHNAHWGQNADVVQNHCFRAVKTAPEIASVMSGFIDFQTRLAPMLMCESAQSLLTYPSALIQRYLVHYNRKQLDIVLLDAMVEALKPAGIEARAHLNQIRFHEHSASHNEVDLLSSCHLPRPQEMMWRMQDHLRPTAYAHSDFFKAFWPESQFIFIGRSGSPVQFLLICRLPTSGQGRLAITVNEVPLQEEALSEGWKTISISVPGQIVRDDVNVVALHWPVPKFPGEKGLEQACDDLIHGMFPAFFPTFGEIHSFKSVRVWMGGTAKPGNEPLSPEV